RYSKCRKDGGSDVGKRRVSCIDGTVAQKNPRHQGVIHAVIAAPGIGVVLENVSRKIAQDGLPSSPITAIVADDEIRALVGIGALINFAGSIDARDRGQIVLW